MIELILVYCLSELPNQCVEQREKLEWAANSLSCSLDAQRIAGVYVQEHPKWRLAGFRCEIDKPRQIPA